VAAWLSFGTSHGIVPPPRRATADQEAELDTTPPTAQLSSPCTGNCKLDAQHVCVGCGRRMFEIVAWPDASDERRAQIRAAAAARLPRPA